MDDVVRLGCYCRLEQVWSGCVGFLWCGAVCGAVLVRGALGVAGVSAGTSRGVSPLYYNTVYNYTNPPYK